MVAAAQTPRSILAEFELPGRRNTQEELREQNPYVDAFQALATTDGAAVVLADTSVASPNIIQAKRKPGGKGGSKDNGNGNDTNPNKKAPEKHDDDNQNRRDGRNGRGRRGFDFDLGDGQGQQQEQSASGGLHLTWENPLGLVSDLMNLSSNEESPQRPAYGITVGRRGARSARR